ncbi:MAG: hypothetical protein JEY97_00895 [Bacteroidales bacterium]|nr:hypothetical protein [Bacteroidales bacterium]
MKTYYKNYLIIICLIYISISSIKVNAMHFNFEGVNCGIVWTIFLQGITLDGIDLEAGDEIAIFDGDTIVGVFYLTQVCTPDNVFENACPAFGPDYPCGGYNPGNPVSFKCWDASECVEGKEFTAQYLNPYGGAWTENVFPEGDGQYSMLEISFTSASNEQQIELSEGYSFISSRIITENPDIQNILQNKLENIEFVRNSQGLMLQKIGPTWVNNIGDWVNTEGYLFKVLSDDDLVIFGEPIESQTPITLSTGYQLIGYLSKQTLDTEEAFQDVLENLEFVRNTEGLMFWKIGPVWVNNIGDMQPGDGYLVKMNSNDILIYPFICGDHFTDPRNGQIYSSVQIGDQCWMAENLNVGEIINSDDEMTNNGIIEKYCYDNNPIYCNYYGALYQWQELMQYSNLPGTQGICPDRWHIPTDDELKILEGNADSQYAVGDPIWNNTGCRGYDAGKNLKSTTGWWIGQSSDLYDFRLLPAGYYTYLANFNFHTSHGYLWSSTENNSDSAYYRDFRCSWFNIYRSSLPKYHCFSVRCLKN